MKKVLYLGLQPPSSNAEVLFIHYPVIRIVPRDPQSKEISEAFQNIGSYSHLIFTSKTAIELFWSLCNYFHCTEKAKAMPVVAVGKQTAKLSQELGFSVAEIAEHETAEGVGDIILKKLPASASFFWAHSALSRPFLSNFFKKYGRLYYCCAIYDTVSQKPPSSPSLQDIDEILFTSPSTVEAFFKIFSPSDLPTHLILKPIGPITAQTLRELQKLA